ncbi:hypothetical protein BAE44_0024892 [Dichanthelium oligosanthes]|uniref:25S rRNA (uridine-N(3))-methyltransferase BMT5-like domain-containing protein n=1 Tax=Dichanthelium oligosanthes TaxID=888268 RepID=A0A1E5UMI7_9POAL|nr:hypothetical protein BAE44_0024892 [Dichanthelium oligosanthes]
MSTHGGCKASLKVAEMEKPPAGEERVKWLGHYSSGHSILIVGDGDFSLALATAFGSGANLVATSLDSYGYFGSLGFVATTGGELRLDPTFAPGQALSFGILDFVADHLGDLYLHNRALTQPREVTEQPVFEGGALFPICDGLLCCHAVVGLPANSTFVGMASYVPASFLDLLEDSSGASSSKAGYLGDEHVLHECYMVNIADSTPSGVTGGNDNTPPQRTPE